MIEFIKNQDIFTTKCHAIVNPVNCVGVMGAGLALQFKNKFPDMFKEYKIDCELNSVKPGKINIHEINKTEYKSPLDRIPYSMYHGKKPEDRLWYIINFPTKNHWKEQSKIEYIEQGLDDLNQFIVDINLRSIAIPKLGCGLGGLDWKEVKEILINKCNIDNCNYIVLE